MTYRRPNPPRALATGCAVAFLLVFVVVGLVGLGTFVGAFRTTLAARTRWPETTCRIEASRIVESDGDEGTTYSPEFTFVLRDRAGREHRATGFDGWNVSGSHKSANAALERYPVGSEVPCWYDPVQPEKAVISRGWRGAWFAFLIPFLFVGAGSVMLVVVLRRSRRTAPRGLVPPWVPPEIPTNPGRRLAHALTAASPVTGSFPGLLGVALVWNLIVAVAAAAVFEEGAGTWGRVIVVIFGLVGALVAWGAVRAGSAQFASGKLVCETSAVDLRPGESFDVHVRFTGRPRVDRLDLRLVCEERATYTVGTDTTTARADVHETTLDSRENVAVSGLEVLELACRARVPEDAVHSFASPRNAIEWSLSVRVRSPHRPPVERRYPLRVLPPRAA